jgi:hypothetical protein
MLDRAALIVSEAVVDAQSSLKSMTPCSPRSQEKGVYVALKVVALLLIRWQVR